MLSKLRIHNPYDPDGVQIHTILNLSTFILICNVHLSGPRELLDCTADFHYRYCLHCVLWSCGNDNLPL